MFIAWNILLLWECRFITICHHIRIQNIRTEETHAIPCKSLIFGNVDVEYSHPSKKLKEKMKNCRYMPFTSHTQVFASLFFSVYSMIWSRGSIYYKTT
jgi:hypothetical protein